MQIEALQIYPEIGRKGRVKGTRELVISQTPLIVIYRIKPKTKHIEILRILHHAQKQNLLMQNWNTRFSLADTSKNTIFC